jgi:hypothetical protein
VIRLAHRVGGAATTIGAFVGANGVWPWAERRSALRLFDHPVAQGATVIAPRHRNHPVACAPPLLNQEGSFWARPPPRLLNQEGSKPTRTSAARPYTGPRVPNAQLQIPDSRFRIPNP